MKQSFDFFHLGRALFFLLLAAVPLRAAELKLANGDRITGTLISRDRGKIHFYSPLLGDLVVSEKQAMVVADDDKAVEALAGLPPIPAKPAVSSASSPEAAPPTADTVPAATETTSPKWKGKIEFGFANQQGRANANNISLRADAEHTDGPDNLRLSGRYLYGKSETTVTSDRQDASFRWRHELSETMFGQTVSSYSSDTIKGIDYDLEQNAGIGYKFLRRPRHTASVGAGVTLQYRAATDLEQSLAYLGELFQDYTYKINGHFTLLQEAGALYAPESRGIATYSGNKLISETDTRSYKLHFNTTLQGKFNERISLNIRYEYEYDSTIADLTARADQRITSSIGYAF
ncbi:DUF481 domain-containing protein [Horticoccus luteus]|uniref:DUF481 domain-containing protein n=1 Tax=Horticoccus luteus TaxID=2862869 RepID=A0A8F9TTI6_9BACT|nr:DUF481 domain-containing protein [Horticoccus luteus]QYM78765.1 DUF481 domain-containing protein [Horticoccus luteus]